MTSNYRKQGKEKTLKKTNAGQHFHLCPAHPPSTALGLAGWSKGAGHGYLGTQSILQAWMEAKAGFVFKSLCSDSHNCTNPHPHN